MPPKVLILPIETKARELPGKVLLASHAARAGYEVVLGDQRVVAANVHRLPRGIYIDKSITRTKIAHYRRLKRLGHLVTAWCEEGLVYRDTEAYRFERLSPVSMSFVDAFFAWGEAHRRDVVAAIPEARDKVHAHGNPRFDLLRPPYVAMLEAEARRLAERHGRLILVVTTFSRFNRHKGQRKVVDVLRARGFSLTAEQEAYYGRLVDHVGQVFEAFKVMIPALARAFPDRTVVLRPHPSEDHEQWRRALADSHNVKVIYDGSVEPWLLAADAVVHNASTIGIEASLLDRPVFSYMPVMDDVFNRLMHLPNAISVRSHTVEELLSGVRRAVEGRPEPTSPETRAFVARFAANVAGELAVDRIVRELTALHEARPPVEPAGLGYMNAWSSLAARRVLSRLRQRVRPNAHLRAYMNQKFPGLSLGEVEAHLRAVARLDGHGDDIVVAPHPHLDFCFTISARGAERASLLETAA